MTHHDVAYDTYCSFAVNVPSDYVLVERINKEKGGPYCPRGCHDPRRLAAALGVYDAYNEFVPPSWGHTIARKKTIRICLGGLMS